ncbi:YlzJ-like family protein [Niallia sp. Krafla_26]|uniref:YlzJ-like family protein n=1 Tax=Niallia sp. Krafla_26 TaxID=3064703 RepID=UPI003D162939
MPQELIFQTDEMEYGKQTMIDYGGVPLLVEMDDNHDYRVIRIMSSDPCDYLDERYCPGTILSNKKF